MGVCNARVAALFAVGSGVSANAPSLEATGHVQAAVPGSVPFTRRPIFNIDPSGTSVSLVCRVQTSAPSEWTNAFPRRNPNQTETGLGSAKASLCSNTSNVCWT